MDNQYRMLLAHPLTKMGIIGILTAKTGFLKSLMAKIYLSSYAFILILAFMQFFYMEWTILNFVDQCEPFFSFSQTFFKLTVCFLQKRKFLSLLKYSANFWNMDDCSEETKNRINNLSNNILLIQKGFFYAVIICVTAILLSVLGGRKLPIGTWSMTEYKTLYKMDLVVINIAFIFNCFFIPSYDCLFVGFCCEVANQFQILYDHLENLINDTANCNQDIIQLNKKLNNCIRQHSFLIRYFKKLQETYSVTLMIQCITVVPIICAEIIALSQDITYVAMLRYGLCLYCVVMQIAFYCIPAEYVTSQASTISNGIYNSKWYLKYPGLKKKSMQMMIQISQRDIEFFAMGIIVIRASTLVGIFKIAMSTKTLISNLDAV